MLRRSGGLRALAVLQRPVEPAGPAEREDGVAAVEGAEEVRAARRQQQAAPRLLHRELGAAHDEVVEGVALDEVLPRSHRVDLARPDVAET